MIRFLRLSLLTMTIAVLAISCNQDPTSIGSNLISDQDKFTFQQLNSDQANLSQKSSYFEYTPALGNSQYVLLGKTPYSESSLLMHYEIYMPDSTLTMISNNTVTVKQVWMTMIPRYVIGDKSSAFNFSVHQVRSNWSSVGFDRDSLASLTYDPADVKSGLATTDTTVSFYLKPDVVKEWFIYKSNSSAPKNNGLIFKPEATSKMLGFVGVQPTSVSFETYIHIILQHPNTTYNDTLVVAPDEDVHVVTRKAGFPKDASSDFYLEGGYSLRSSLFFDVSSLPKNAIINKATLELTTDVSKELDGSLKSDSIYVQILADSTTHKLSSDSTTVSILSRKDNVFSGDIAWIVQKWLNGHVNTGMLLTFYDEYSSGARIAFYGSNNSNKALRPKLKLTYLQKK